MTDKYLGDGVYLKDHKYDLQLYTSNGEVSENSIYLDASVAKELFRALKDWLYPGHEEHETHP